MIVGDCGINIEFNLHILIIMHSELTWILRVCSYGCLKVMYCKLINILNKLIELNYIYINMTSQCDSIWLNNIWVWIFYGVKLFGWSVCKSNIKSSDNNLRWTNKAVVMPYKLDNDMQPSPTKYISLKEIYFRNILCYVSLTHICTDYKSHGMFYNCYSIWPGLLYYDLFAKTLICC